MKLAPESASHQVPWLLARSGPQLTPGKAGETVVASQLWITRGQELDNLTGRVNSGGQPLFSFSADLGLKAFVDLQKDEKESLHQSVQFSLGSIPQCTVHSEILLYKFMIEAIQTFLSTDY